MTIQADAAGAADHDRWFAWLRTTRCGGDAAYAAALAPAIAAIRDIVLDNAELAPGQAIADIGCGDGFTGLGALERQPSSRVAFVDISPALIDCARTAAAERGFESHSRFIVASADAIPAIATASVDVVLVRAVLAYIDDKAAVLGELMRMLRPGGRISIVDPINADRAFAATALARQLASDGDTEAKRHLELLHRCRSAYYPDSLEALRRDSLTNYNERDLLRLFECAGFVNIHLRLHIDSVPLLPMPWAAYLASAPRAGVPTIGEVLEARFSAAERIAFERFLRPGVESGTLTERNINAFIFADAPNA